MLETIREFAAELLAASGEARRDPRPPRRRRSWRSPSGPRPSCPATTSAPGWTGSSASTTTCARRWTGRSPAATRDVAIRLAFALWRFWQKRGYLDEARRRLEAMDARAVVARRPATRARLIEALGGVVLVAGATAPTAPRSTTRRSRSGGRSATDARSPTRYYNRVLRRHDRRHARRSGTIRAASGGRARGGARDLPRSSATARRGRTCCGASATMHYFQGGRRRRRARYRERARALPRRSATGRWRRGRCTCWRHALMRQRATSTEATADVRHACAFPCGRRRRRPHRSPSTTCRSSPSAEATWSGRRGCGARRRHLADDGARASPTSSSEQFEPSASPTSERACPRPTLGAPRREGAAMTLDETRRLRPRSRPSAAGRTSRTGGRIDAELEPPRSPLDVPTADRAASTVRIRARRCRPGRPDPDLRQLRRRDGRAQVQARSAGAAISCPARTTTEPRSGPTAGAARRTARLAVDDRRARPDPRPSRRAASPRTPAGATSA